MCAIYRHAHARDRRLERGQMHDLASLILHFHFFFRVTAFQENIDMRQNVERNLMWITLRGGLSILRSRYRLPFQFFNRPLTAAGDRLITGRENPANSEGAMQWIDRHERDRGRAVRVRDQTALFVDVVAVDFWNNQG